MATIRWFAPATGPAEAQSVSGVVRSQFLNDGPLTKKFEDRVAKFLGVNYCVAVPNGTSAITLALIAAGIKPGDEVLVPDLTFIATANAVRLAGATPVLVDVEPNRLTIDPEKAAKRISKRTKAIVPVDVNGRGAYYEELEGIAKRKGLQIICDAAEALGSKYRGKYLGTFGAAGCFSFSPNKTVTTGQGGMVATNSTALYHRLHELKDQGRRYRGTGGNDLHPVMGYNFKFTDLQAAVGLKQMDRLKDRLAHAVLRDLWYREFLEDIPGVVLPVWDRRGGEILQWTDALINRRGRVEKFFTRHGIGYRPFWFPLHRQNPYRGADKNFPNSVSISARGLWLPSAFDLTKAQAQRVATLLRRTLV